MFARHRTTVITAIQPETTRQQAGPCRNPLRFIRQGRSTQQHAIGPIAPIGDHVHAVVDAVADIHIKPPWLAEEGFILRGTAAITMTSRIVLGICFRFHDHTPKQAAIVLAFHQPAPNQLRTDNFCRTAEVSMRQGWEILGDEFGCYRSGLKT